MNAAAITIDAHPLIERLAGSALARWIGLADVDAFISAPGDHVLFFHSDPVRFPECLDVAVVLPELAAAHPGRFDVGVVVPADAEALSQRFGRPKWPSLVFFRDGRYVTSIGGILDWTDYVERVGAALAMQPTRVPIGIPVAVEGGASAGCGGAA